MRTSFLGLMTAGLAVLLVSPEAQAAPNQGSLFKLADVKDAKFSHGLVLKARKHDEADFSEKTTKYGVECYKDENNDRTVYICETGSIAVVPGAPLVAAGVKPKDAMFTHGLVLKARKFDEADFTGKTTKYGVECYTDGNTGYVIYITEAGNITAVKGGVAPAKPIQDAKFSHGLILKARKHAEADFTPNTKKYGVECYSDANNKLTLYVTETGSIAVSAAAPAAMAPAQVKDAKFVYGLVLKARKHDEAEFGEKTAKYGVESYNDENNGNGIHITENGVITVIDAKFTPPMKVADAVFKHGLVLKARKYDEADFGAATRKHGIECYLDDNSKFMLYITEAGVISVIK